jgi:hypothetical protein
MDESIDYEEYNYDSDSENDEFLLNIETIFDEALKSENKENCLLNIVDLCQSVQKGKIWEYQCYEELIKDSIKNRNLSNYKKYFEKLFNIYPITNYYKKHETISKIFNNIQIQLSFLSDIVNYSLKILRKLNQSDKIIEIINILKIKYLFYLKDDGNIYFYIIPPNIGGLINKNLLHINLEINELPKKLIEYGNKENQNIFFFGDLFALVKFKSFTKNIIYFYNNKQENIFQIETQQIVINIELLNNLFGYYSTSNYIVFFDIQNQIILNSIYFHSIYYTKAIKDEYIFTLFINQNKKTYIAILSKVKKYVYQSQIIIELNLHYFFDFFIDKYTSNISNNIIKYFFNNTKPYFTENEEEQNHLFIFNKKFMFDDDNFFYNGQIDNHFKFYKYFLYLEHDDFNNSKTILNPFKVLNLDNYFVLSIYNKDIFIIEKNIFKIIRKVNTLNYDEIFSGKNNTIILNSINHIIRIYSCPDLKELYYFYISYSIIKNEFINNNTLTDNLIKIINQNKCVYVKKNNLLYIYYISKDSDKRNIKYITINLNQNN